jgi:hypothetical protein
MMNAADAERVGYIVQKQSFHWMRTVLRTLILIIAKAAVVALKCARRIASL